MSETERRKGYVSTRVLIDAARVLTPTFDDTVVYLTGAQLEVLRNLTQYANRPESYVAEYESGYYLTPDNDDWDDIQAIVADLEESLMGNPNTIWGYKDVLWGFKHSVSNVNGTYHSYSSVVPSGEVWVVNMISCLRSANANNDMRLSCYHSSAYVELTDCPIPVVETYYPYPLWGVLTEDEYLRFSYFGATVDEDCDTRYWGYKMVVP